MNWTSDMFSGVTTQITAILPVVLPVAIGVFAIGLALRYGKKVLRMFS
jgi:hypothetical protein